MTFEGVYLAPSCGKAACDWIFKNTLLDWKFHALRLSLTEFFVKTHSLRIKCNKVKSIKYEPLLAPSGGKGMHNLEYIEGYIDRKSQILQILRLYFFR